jgi:hypothetical protein
LSLSGGGQTVVTNKSLTRAAFADGSGLTVQLATNNTAYSSNDTTGNWIPFVTITLTNAQADYAKITLIAHIEQNTNAGAGASSTAYCRAESTAPAQIGQMCTSIFAQNGFGGGTTGNCLEVILVAGTDYTQGTGFTFKIAHRCVAAGGGAGTSNVLGMTLLGEI